MAAHPKILIMAASGAYNLGDECIVAREVSILRKLYPMSHITIATYDASSSLLTRDDPQISYIQYFPSGLRSHPWDNISYLFKNIIALIRSDILVIGGGGIFFSTLGEKLLRRQLWQWYFRIFLARFFGTRVFFWSVSIEIPEAGFHGLLKKVFSGTKNRVSVRDPASQKILQNIGIKAEIIPDPVIGYSLLRESVNQKKIQTVGIAMRHEYLKDEKNNLIEMIQFLKHRGYKVELLSFSLHPTMREENDYIMFKEIAESLSVTITSSIDETLTHLRDVDIMIAMRLHAAILATSTGIPTLVVSYGSKTQEFAQSLGLPVIDAPLFSFPVFQEEFAQLTKESEDTKIELAQKTKNISLEAIEKVGTIFRELYPLGE